MVSSTVKNHIYKPVYLRYMLHDRGINPSNAEANFV